MSRYKAEKAATQMLTSGCLHHSYEDEKKLYSHLFNCEREEINRILSTSGFAGMFNLYADILGPNRLRGTKNSVICMLTQISREAIEYGADAEFSFALSDYYINELEKQTSELALRNLAHEILMHYYDLVQQEKMGHFSQPIVRAIRFMNRNLFGTCTIKQVAEYLSLDPHYLSGLFRKEVGIPPSKYICQQKMEEAEKMLTLYDYSVAKVADILGYYDISHFSRVFKIYYGKAPSSLHKST
ncbi:MAG: helix-turn-helix domain-containing protein [Mobilitalea sp.]